MTTPFAKALLIAASLAGSAAMTLPASALPVQRDVAATSPAQLASWADRVRGRTSSSTGEVGYGYGYRGAYTGYDRYGYDRVPYGYDQGPVDYDGGYGYGAY